MYSMLSYIINGHCIDLSIIAHVEIWITYVITSVFKSTTLGGASVSTLTKASWSMFCVH